MKRYIKSAIMSLSEYDWRDLTEMALDESASPEMLMNIATIDGHLGYAIADCLIRNPNVTSAVLDVLVDRGAEDYDYDQDIFRTIASHPKVSPTTLSKIVDIVIQRASTCPGRWHRVIEDIACMSKTPLSGLRKLSNYPDYDIRCGVARNPKTSTAILKHLLTVDPDVRWAVASNPNIDIPFLVKESDSPYDVVRENVACNPKTPIDILVKLASDRQWIVRLAVTSNKNTPVEVLQKLANDRDYDVSCGAKLALREPLSE